MKNAVKEPKTQEDMLREKLKNDSVAALKNHENRLVEVLRFLISLIDKKELQLPPGAMTDNEMISVLRKELKNKEESREMFLKAGRNDLVEQLDYEIEITKNYLPKEVEVEDLEKIVEEAIAEQGTNFGLVMKTVMSKVAGGASGDVISKIVKEKISER